MSTITYTADAKKVSREEALNAFINRDADSGHDDEESTDIFEKAEEQSFSGQVVREWLEAEEITIRHDNEEQV